MLLLLLGCVVGSFVVVLGFCYLYCVNCLLVFDVSLCLFLCLFLLVCVCVCLFVCGVCSCLCRVWLSLFCVFVVCVALCFPVCVVCLG